MIYCDESGFTGINLLDDVQTSFAYVSNDFSYDEAYCLLEIFNTGQSKNEVKFSKIKKLKDIDVRYEKFFTSDLYKNNRVVISLYNKEFYLITKLVDTIIEPILFRLGYDLYEDRMNLQTALFLYFALQNEEHVKREFLNSFNNMLRCQSTENIEKFKLVSKILTNKTNDEYLKNTLSVYDNVNNDIILSDISSDNMYDTITTAIYDHINIWGIRRGLCNIDVNSETKLLDLYIDQTKSLKHQSFITDVECMRAKIGDHIEPVGNTRNKYLIPLPISSYRLVNSKDIIQIQVSDIISGFFCCVYNNRNNQDHPLVRLFKKLNLECYPMCPEAYCNIDFETENKPNLVESVTDFYIQRKKS